jgi:hypothetical protein
MSTGPGDRSSPPPDDHREPTPERAGNRGGVDHPETTPAQERGERLDTGKAIARGGKTEGHVPGADPPKQ